MTGLTTTSPETATGPTTPDLGRAAAALVVAAPVTLLVSELVATRETSDLSAEQDLAFLLANACPILELRVQGSISRATLLDAILALWSEDRQLVAALVFATGLLAPLADLLAMTALLAAVLAGRRPAYFAPLLRLIQQVRPWGMIEVLMLGVLVSLIKLSHLAQVVPGVALWAFIALTVLLAAVLSYDPCCLWQLPAGRKGAP